MINGVYFEESESKTTGFNVHDSKGRTLFEGSEPFCFKDWFNFSNTIPEPMFEINKPDGDTIRIFLNGDFLRKATNESHGYHGMEALEGLIVTIAEMLKVPVRITYHEED